MLPPELLKNLSLNSEELSQVLLIATNYIESREKKTK